MTRPALLLAVQIAVVTAILGCLVALAALHPFRVDLTPERRFTLSPHKRAVLKRLDADVDVTVFYSSQAEAMRRDMEDLLRLYHDAQPRVSIRFLDLDRSPGMAKRLGVDDYNTAVVATGERREHVPLVNETALTGALLAVAGTPPVPTYFVVGHGEHDPRDDDERAGASEAARALASEGFAPRALDGAAVVPPDAGLVVLAGPTRDLARGEVDALAAWVEHGGRLVVLTDPGTPASVRALVARFGIEPAGDLVVDEQARLFGTDGLSARIAYLNQGLFGEPPGVQALLPEAQSVRLVDVPGVRADYLAMTGDGTWADVARRSLEGRGRAAFDPARDRQGPVPVAAFAVTRAADDAPEGRVVVIGDADFVTNLHVNLLGNRDLLLAVAGLVGRGDPLTAARPAAPPGGTFSPLTLTAREGRIVFWSVVVAPTAAMALLAGVLSRRRRWA
jgi:gliding motility-associatede transport system auxiliary component